MASVLVISIILTDNFEKIVIIRLLKVAIKSQMFMNSELMFKNSELMFKNSVVFKPDNKILNLKN